MRESPIITLTMPAELLDSIEDYRFDRRLPSRSLAIRQLIEAGLAAKREADLKRFVEKAVDGRKQSR